MAGQIADIGAIAVISPSSCVIERQSLPRIADGIMLIGKSGHLGIGGQPLVELNRVSPYFWG